MPPGLLTPGPGEMILVPHAVLHCEIGDHALRPTRNNAVAHNQGILYGNPVFRVSAGPAFFHLAKRGETGIRKLTSPPTR